MPGTGKQESLGKDQYNRDQRQEGRAGGWWRPIALLVFLVAVIVLARTVGVGERLGDLRDWIRRLGAWGPVVFVPLYAVAVSAALPGSALTVTAGALFGSVLGVVVVSTAATLGASLSFLIARYFARDAIARWLSPNETFRRLDQLTEQHGAMIVALTRLVPIFPFNLLNYGFGLTRVPFWTYVFWSWLCMLPGTLLYVVGADAVTQGIARGEVPWLLIGAMGGVGVLLALLVRYAQRTLQNEERALPERI
ncbi:MAG: TVP38/TMEM64 family protein [Deltaproteobacteria bacterium]|nr:TVP38/TMEM64 family protein [Deltaproteobacteria bacterium]